MSGGGEQASASGDGVAVCRHCGTAFHKSNAKFCSRCGTSRDVRSSTSNGERKRKTTKGEGVEGVEQGLASTLKETTSTTPVMPPLFASSPKGGVGSGGAVVGLEGGKNTLSPFDVAQLQQQLHASRKEPPTDAAAAVSLEFRDPSATNSLTSPKKHPTNLTPVPSAVAATAAPLSSNSPLSSLTGGRPGGSQRENSNNNNNNTSSGSNSHSNGGGASKSAIYAKDNTLPELPPASLADPRRFTRNHSESSEEPETTLAGDASSNLSKRDGVFAPVNAAGAATAASSARTPVPPREQPPSQGGRPSSASPLTAQSKRRISKSRAQASAVEDATAFVDGTAPPAAASSTLVLSEQPTGPSSSSRPPLLPSLQQDDSVSQEVEVGGEEEPTRSLLHPSAEEEAQYTAWATLPPDGLTPEMLQTSNASELRRWRKGSLIGRGTYGSVYLGLLPDGSFYAVKSVELGNKKAAADHLNVLELVSLSREINMMHRLRHRNLCTFKGVYYDAENAAICMFMEYIGGGSLSSLVKRFKPLPPSVVRSWTKQLLSGLHYLHTQHIIHRDIKGDNVLVDTSADPSTQSQIKLVDFGAARRLTDAVSQSSTVIGTPYWMAPEVVDASGDGGGYSYKADVWSVGCTVAEMLTGRPPWPCKTSAPAAIMMIASATGMPTEIPEEEATPGCLDFMKKCFIRDPEKRPTVQMLLQHPWIQGKME